MDLSFLPQIYVNALSNCKLSDILEIRLRLNFPVTLRKIDGKFFLGNNGQTLLESNAIVCLKSEIEQILLNLTERSIYAYSEQINSGYLTWKNGVRVGLTGECIFDSDKIIDIKNIRSLNIRLPHEIINSSDKIFNIINSGKIYNTLIVSDPLKGKTTIIKDLIRKFDQLNIYNLLVIDERGEFYNCTGNNVDIISRCNKSYAFEMGLRSMSPEIVFTDELYGESDVMLVKNAIECGVKVIASCHGNDFNYLIKKNYNKIFDRIIILDSFILGEIKEVIYCNKK